MEYLHEQGVIHRDVKLENILLDESYKIIKIIDFGFSIRFNGEKKLNVFCGTPSYMAPEICKKSEYYGKPADIWSLGIVLYVLLFSRFPFKGIIFYKKNIYFLFQEKMIMNYLQK